MEITNTVPKEYEDNDAYMNIVRRVSDKKIFGPSLSAPNRYRQYYMLQ